MGTQVQATGSPKEREGREREMSGEIMAHEGPSLTQP